MLVEHLPRESATMTALRNQAEDEGHLKDVDPAAYRPDRAPWSQVETLLADIKDQLVLSRHVAIAAAGGKPGTFHPTPRPGIPPAASSSPKRLSDEQRRALDPRLRNQQPKEATDDGD
ncbi:hypothetical protein [Streptomyces hydrogenans]|uniref:hypothetical protein n=1 Tax=Streptomyces hydrogenans TaxID=1873719 RepID=UPI0035DF2B93